MEEYYDILMRCPLFKDIQGEDFNSLFLCMNSFIKTYKSNEYILLEGTEVNYVGIVLSGSLELIKENYEGNKYILDFLGTSDIFGEGVVCTSSRMAPITVMAKEKSKVLFIPFEKIIRTCGSSCEFHFQLIRNMMLILGEKNYNMNNKIELLILKGMREKLATYLYKESKRQKSTTFQIKPNRNELAEYLNVSRTSMCRELARMKEEGILDYYQNSFKIISMDKLNNGNVH